jgi:hypothetical protein
MQPVLFKHNLLVCCLKQKFEGTNYSLLSAIGLSSASQNVNAMPFTGCYISLRKGKPPGNMTTAANEKTVWVVITNQISRANTIPDVVSQTVTSPYTI